MTSMLKPGETVLLTPASEAAKPETERITYHLRAPTLYDRIKLLSAVETHGGRHHSPLALVAALKREVAAVMEASPAKRRGRVLGLIDAHRERLEGFYARLRDGVLDLTGTEGQAAFMEALGEAEAGADTLAAIEHQARQLGGNYAVLTAENAVYAQVFGIEAARLFLTGWDNLGTIFARDESGVAETALMAVPAEHFIEIGAKVRALLAPTEAEVKNSDGPQSGGCGPAPSKGTRKRAKKTH